MILSGEITAELKEEFIQLLLEGIEIDLAAEQLGTTATQLKRHRNPKSVHFDPDFADRFAVAAEEGRELRNEEMRDMARAQFRKALERGEKWAVEKALYATDPLFEQLRHPNLRVSGEVLHRHELKSILPHMTDDQIDRLLEERGIDIVDVEPLQIEAPADDD